MPGKTWGVKSDKHYYVGNSRTALKEIFSEINGIISNVARNEIEFINKGARFAKQHANEMDEGHNLQLHAIINESSEGEIEMMYQVKPVEPTPTASNRRNTPTVDDVC